MTFKFARMGTLALGLALVGSQAMAADAKDAVVAVVNGTEIHESQLRETFAGLPPQLKSQVSPRQLVEFAINNKLIADEARKEKLDSDPEVKKSVKVVEEQFMRQAWVKKRGLAVSDDQVKKRFDEWIPTFKPQEEVHAHHILLETEDQAKAVLADLRSGGNFEDIAKAKSKDPSAAHNGGDLGFFTKTQMVPEFADAAFALKVGDVTAQPVKSQFGWHVIRLDEKRMSTAPTFADVKEEIRAQLGQLAVQDAVKSLHDKAKIDIKMPDAPAAK